jgi:hypothetical protein
MADHLMLVFSNAKPEIEDHFNDWYTNVHLAEVSSRPGFTGARRFAPAAPGKPYIAIYEMDADDLQKATDEMMAFYAAGGFTNSDALQTDPPAIVGTLTEIARYNV